VLTEWVANLPTPDLRSLSLPERDFWRPFGQRVLHYVREYAMRIAQDWTRKRQRCVNKVSHEVFSQSMTASVGR